MTATVDRSPCPACAEPIAAEARLCPHCRTAVLFEVRLDAPVADARVRYRMARALAPLPGARSLGELQARLGRPGAALVAGLTAEEARRWTEAVAASGAAAASRWTGGVAPSGRRTTGPALAAAAAGIAALVAVVLVARGRRDAPGTAAPPAPATTPVAAATPAGAAAPLSTREIAARALPSTVSLRCRDSVGAGFFVTSDTLLTNAHVLCAGGALRVVFADGREGIGTVERQDRRVDIALVKVIGAVGTPLGLGDAGTLSVGDRVMFIGSPVGMDFTVHEGMVSNVGRPLRGVAYVQLDAKVNPGNSGGPLLDEIGQVVGIVSLKHAQAEGIALALPINYAFGSVLPNPSPPRDSTRFAALATQARWAGTEAGEGEEAEEFPTPDGEGPGFPRPRRFQGGEPAAPGGERAGREGGAMLVGGRVDEYRRIVARVLRVAYTTPAFEQLSFKFRAPDGRVVCAMKGDVFEWKPIDAEREPKLHAFAARLAKGTTGYIGEAPLGVEGCGPGVVRSAVELELEGGDPRSGRIRIY